MRLVHGILRGGWMVAVLAMFGAGDREAVAQSFSRAGTEFNAMRSVTVPSGRQYAVVVTEFFHHGEIRPDGKNVVVTAQNRLVPMRILQLGPGDYCRMAFQPIAGQSEYTILYGGDPPTDKLPAWTSREGLLLETRKFTPCDLNNFETVRDAFEKAEPIGGDYVESVFHSFNPFSLKNAAFLTRASGTMHLAKAAKYGFILSSQDCSFLLIDDKLVASAPGSHGPSFQVTPGSRHDVSLSAGEHKFDYYHAAAGETAIMVIAWVIDPVDEKTDRPTGIPPEVFHTHLIAHLPATRLSTQAARQAPDFVCKIINDVPLPDNDVPLIGVLFRDASPKSLTMQGAKVEWDFGDGQTSNLPNVDHIYLRPGTYAVTLSIRHGQKTVATTNRIDVDRPRLTAKDKLFTLDDYRKIIASYNPAKLDAPSLLQMVLMLEAKAEMVAAQADESEKKAKAAEDDPNRRPSARRELAAAREKNRADGLSDADRFLAEAVTAGKAAFVGESAAKGDGDLLKLARLVGPMARERLGDSETAYAIWRGAAQRITAKEAKVECEVVAADIAINDLLKTSEAKTLLDAAQQQLGKNERGPVAAALQRVWGDYFAATGDGKAARQAYLDAERVAGFSQPMVENTATRGAHARSTEEFIQQKDFARAAEEIQTWQRNYPSEKIEGYWTLLAARYWAARGKYAQAVALAEQLQAVNRDSPCVDQLLMLAAECEMRRGRKDRAAATLHSLVKDYPGSPLVDLAKKRIKMLEKRD